MAKAKTAAQKAAAAKAARERRAAAKAEGAAPAARGPKLTQTANGTFEHIDAHGAIVRPEGNPAS